MPIVRRTHLVIALFGIEYVKAVHRTPYSSVTGIEHVDILNDIRTKPRFIVHHSIDQKHQHQPYNDWVFEKLSAATGTPAVVKGSYVVLWPEEIETLSHILLNTPVDNQDAEDAQSYSLGLALKDLIDTDQHTRYVVTYKVYNETIHCQDYADEQPSLPHPYPFIIIDNKSTFIPSE